jgi:hypothetical protein
MRRILTALVATALLAVTAIATAAPAAAQGAGYYVVNRGSLGVVNAPYTTIATVGGSAGQGSLSINQSYSVAKQATLTVGLTTEAISASLTDSATLTEQVQVTCTYETGGRAAVLTAYPRAEVIEYDVYERYIGGGTGNDPYVGRGQFYVPRGFFCQLELL